MQTMTGNHGEKFWPWSNRESKTTHQSVPMLWFMYVMNRRRTIRKWKLGHISFTSPKVTIQRHPLRKQRYMNYINYISVTWCQYVEKKHTRVGACWYKVHYGTLPSPRTHVYLSSRCWGKSNLKSKENWLKAENWKGFSQRLSCGRHSDDYYLFRVVPLLLSRSEVIFVIFTKSIYLVCLCKKSPLICCTLSASASAFLTVMRC